MKKLATILLLVILILISGCAEKKVVEEQSSEEVIEGIEWFQTGNTQDITKLQPMESRELEDNRIGSQWDLKIPDHYGESPEQFIYDINNLGLKWIRLILDSGDWPDVDWDKEYSQFRIKPDQEKTITGLADNDIKILLGLVFWDKESPGQKEEQGYSRFKTEEEIQRYLDYVKFMVGHFKGKIEYYEILNEPNIQEGTQQYVELEDYINLVKRVVPVIREEDPSAKIVVGATAAFREENTKEYLFGILKSDVMPLVDGISFHPMYGTSPEYNTGEIFFDDPKQYYYQYPSVIQEIKNTASAHGFNGEYIADELTWRTARDSNVYEPWTFSEIVAAKYYARGSIINLGLDITVGLGGLEPDNYDLLKMKVVQNSATLMAGAKPIDLPIEIQSGVTNIRSYSFSLSNGDNLIALWTDGVAVDNDPGIKATLTIPNLSAQKVTGTDVLNGYQQQITTSSENGNLVIQNLLVRDYPMMLRIR